MRSDAVVKTTFGLLDLQFLVPLSHSLLSSGCPVGDGSDKVPKERRRLVLFSVTGRQSKIVV